jgi:hypothetical protein
MGDTAAGASAFGSAAVPAGVETAAKVVGTPPLKSLVPAGGLGARDLGAAVARLPVSAALGVGATVVPAELAVLAIVVCATGKGSVAAGDTAGPVVVLGAAGGTNDVDVNGAAGAVGAFGESAAFAVLTPAGGSKFPTTGRAKLLPNCA